MRTAPLFTAFALLVCTAPARADPPIAAASLSPIVDEASRRAGIPARWIWSVMQVESAGDAHAISRAGAMGLMQLMPATWNGLRVRLGLGNDPFDPHDNLLAGAFYLRELHDRYGEPGFLAAYNAGPRRYEDYLNRHRPLPPETLAYLARLSPQLSKVQLAEADAWTRASLFPGASETSDTAQNPLDDDPKSIRPDGQSAPKAGLFIDIHRAANQ